MTAVLQAPRQDTRPRRRPRHRKRGARAKADPSDCDNASRTDLLNDTHRVGLGHRRRTVTCGDAHSFGPCGAILTGRPAITTSTLQRPGGPARRMPLRDANRRPPHCQPFVASGASVHEEDLCGSSELPGGKLAFGVPPDRGPAPGSREAGRRGTAEFRRSPIATGWLLVGMSGAGRVLEGVRSHSRWPGRQHAAVRRPDVSAAGRPGRPRQRVRHHRHQDEYNLTA